MVTVEIVRSESLSRKENEKSNSCLSPSVTSHVISCLDLLSANFDGLAAAAAQHATQFRLLKHLHAILTTDSLDEGVRFVIIFSNYTFSNDNSNNYYY